MTQMSLRFQNPYNYLLAFILKSKKSILFLHDIFLSYKYISLSTDKLPFKKHLSLEMLWHCIKFFCLSQLILLNSFQSKNTVTDQQSFFSFSSLFEEQITCVVHHTFRHIIHVHVFTHKDRGIVTDSFQSLIYPGTVDPSDRLIFGK